MKTENGAMLPGQMLPAKPEKLVKGHGPQKEQTLPTLEFEMSGFQNCAKNKCLLTKLPHCTQSLPCMLNIYPLEEGNNLTQFQLPNYQ